MGTRTGSLQEAIMDLLSLFVAGFAAGLAVCWIYIGRLKATLKLYQVYIHDRLDAQLKSEQPPPTGHNRPNVLSTLKSPR